MKIYESVNNRITEINHIVDYNITKDINKTISTILIITDKHYLKTITLDKILINVIKDINPRYGLPESIKKICKTITNDIKDDNIKESLLTIELNKESVYKFIFINSNNILEDVYLNIPSKELTKKIDSNILKLNKTIYTHMESYRSLGSHIYHSMKKNNIYQCNIIDLTSKEYYLYLKKNNFFTSRNKNLINPLDFLNVSLPIIDGFCLSKYSLNEVKSETIYSKTKTNRFSNNIVKSGGSKTKKKSSLTPNIESKNNYFINIVNINSLNNINIQKLYTPIVYKNIIESLDKILIKIKSIYFARDIVNLPSNKTGSLSIINTVKHFISRNNLPIKIKVLDPKDCLKLGLKLLYSVGQGAEPENQSRLLILEYYGDIKKKNNDGYLLVGKGITMDTGGISIKKYNQIPEMKSDVAGACSVISGICGLSRMGIKKNIIGMIPLAENTVGHKSTIPGDVIKSHKGLNVEIIDTDAEGRLVMADTLSYGCKLYPKYKIIEFSTLTGEVENLSCGRFSTAIGINYDNNELNKFVSVGEYNGERVLMMPFITGFDDELKSDIGDIRNVSRNCKGQLYPSTTFLSYFINDDSKYLHVDIGGTAFTDNKKYKYEHYESTGVGVKLLIDFIAL